MFNLGITTILQSVLLHLFFYLLNVMFKCTFFVMFLFRFLKSILVMI